ncbi:hypothetical protein H9R97_14275 [Klebsiella quasipneumoniae]|uniref:hypothetical protein n=1 Tax=Klebsiella quasipneumoniae TaxID=1463165 RepID=UPI00192C67C2|nr:hypothetical protein [Klebsiella quasipneumoniae]MBL4368919.1 hypothetical protein [Klebsiella quasipneumoniae]
MTKSTITRERLEKIAAGRVDARRCNDDEIAMAITLLAAMDSESVGTLSVRHMSYSGKKIGNQFGFVHSDAAMTIAEGDYPLYRHAQPVPEMKPVGYLFVSEQGAIAYSPANWGMPGFRLIGQIYGDIDVESQPAPAVPDDVLDALQKVARIRLDLNDFDGDRRGIADCLCDAEEALIEVVNRRAAMLAAAPQEVK